MITRMISLGIIAQALWHCGYTQCPDNKVLWNKIISIEKDTSAMPEQKLKDVFALKKQFEDCRLAKDSVYARLLHRIGDYEYRVNNNTPTGNSIHYTLAAIRINSSGRKGVSESYLVNSYTNLGNYYKTLNMQDVALKYYDSALIIRFRYPAHQISKVQLRISKAQVLFKVGDYQKAIEQMTIAIRETYDTGEDHLIPALLNQRAQSYFMQNQLPQAFKDAGLAGRFAGQFQNDRELANSLVLKADILAKEKDFSQAVSLYRKAINIRIRSNSFRDVSVYYTNLGNVYLIELENYAKARECYMKTLEYARKAGDPENLSDGHTNLGIVSLYQRNHKDAGQYFIQALRDLKVPASDNILHNPSSAQLNLIGNKALILAILVNKTKLLLQRLKETADKKFDSACMQTALLTDTMITNMRYLQQAELSKLYWRNLTREFFTDVMEVCHIAGNARLAYYFMEKSRAVLLNDKLNEMNATVHLPEEEVRKEQEFKNGVTEERRKMAFLEENTPEFETQQVNVLHAQEQLELHLKSLEKKYPAYYQYKYEDEVVPLKALQRYLSGHRRNFVHYFMNDTVIYVLGITPYNAKMIRLSKTDFNPGQITSFLYYCANRQALANDYPAFVALAHTLYTKLFRPLQFPKGGVIICPDNFLVPFEALCADAGGERFLVNDYVFSYVYSARYLLKNKTPSTATGDFIGFAPVSFETRLKVPDLNASVISLQKSASHYSGSKLFTGNKATKSNFLGHISRYAIVHVLSHAQADTGAGEPLLFMQDSVIRVSELQVLRQPATRLVLLSACQTNVGKNATGEGIYSFARGLAATGIPSVVATLWEADEHSIYALSESFHKYLSQGMYKDDALQRAKLDFLQINSDNRKSLPYFWAGMIVMGNMEPVALPGYPKFHLIISGVMVIIILTFIISRKRNRSGNA